MDTLVAELDDPRPKVRLDAANSLWGCWEDLDEPARARALPVLHRVARDDLDGPTRANAVAAILASRSPGAIDLAVAALADDDWAARATVASVLGDHPDERIVDALIPLLQDPDGYVRTAAAYSLGKHGDTRALGPLRRLATHERDFSEARKAATWSIEQIGGPRTTRGTRP